MSVYTTTRGKVRSDPLKNPDYDVAVRTQSSVLALIAFMLILVLGACRGRSWASTDVACRAGVSSMLARFLASSEPFNDNSVFSMLSQCADRSDLSALLDALVRPDAHREPLEIEGAIEAALRSPELASDPAATQLISDRFHKVNDPGARASLTYLLGWRGASELLNRTLSEDPSPYVRVAAALSLRNCKTPPDFAPLWHAAKTDSDRQVRANAYETLDRFGQLRTAEDFLAASRDETSAASAGRFLGRWLQVGNSPEDETAETLTHLAEHTGSDEASGAIAEIFRALESPPKPPVAMSVRPPVPPPIGGSPSQASGMALIQPIPVAPAEPEETELQRALYRLNDRITSAALAQFAASKNMQEDAARVAIDCALAVNRCDTNGCERLNYLLSETDRMSPPLALEASHDIATRVGGLYFALRYRQFALLFSLAALIVLVVLFFGYMQGGGRTVAVGAGSLLLILSTAVLQFTSGPLMGVSVWPPPRLWPATALGSVSTTLLVSVPVTLAFGWKRLVPTALIAGEIAWWFLPSLFAAAGITLRMQHYSDEDWLPFMLMLAMPIGAPLLTLALSSAAMGCRTRLLGTIA